MKFLLTCLFSLITLNYPLEAQELTIEETLNAINGYFKEISSKDSISIDSSYRLIIYSYGREKCSSYIEELEDEVRVYGTFTEIIIECIDSRYKCMGVNNYGSCTIYTNTRYTDKFRNALNYLIAKAKSERLLHLQPDNDPFASPVPFYNQTISGKLPLIKTDGGLYLIPIILNQSLKQNFILDSGASEITINRSIFNLLKDGGTIKDSDILQPAYYQIADGSKVLKRRVNIKELRIGNYIINDVIASVSEDDGAPLLLGQSVLKKLGTISIDYTNHQLIIK